VTSTPVTRDLGARPGVVDFYGALGDAVRERVPHAAIVAEAALIACYFLARTVNVPDAVLGVWLALAAVVTLISPTSGLVLLAAIGPFSEGILVARGLGGKPFLVVLLVLAVASRVAIRPTTWVRPPAAVLLAIAILAGTAAGLVVNWIRFGPDSFNGAWQTWLGGIASALVVFIAAAWVARRGELRPLVVVLAAAAAAALVSLADFLAPEAFRSTFLGWTASAPPLVGRLTGVIRSPTSTAALIMIPATVLLTAAALGRGLWLRLAALAVAVPLLLAAYLTYNRAVFLALFAVAVVVGWRIRRPLGVGILAVGLVIGALLVPGYMSARGAATGAVLEPGQVLIASDQQRLNAWATAGRMFLDSPLIGQGYRSYREVGVSFGDTVLNAPHNEWLRLFAEDGVVVGLAGLAFVAVTAWTLARKPGWLETATLGAFLSFVLAAAFNNPFLFNQVTIPAFVVAGTGIALSRLGGPEPASRAE
jgi:O-antigen ligase/polysaccharide polymerase Wzy-like membrane protein